MSEATSPLATDLLRLKSRPQPVAPNGRGRGQCVAVQVFPRWELLLPGEPVALDIEFLDWKFKNQKMKFQHRCGWIAIVNTRGDVILDVFVRYEHNGNICKDYPPRMYGVLPERLYTRNGAVDAAVVEGWVKKIIQSRPVIVHGGQHDLNAFQIEDVFAGVQVIDTQKHYAYMQSDGTPGLKTLALELQEKNVQEDIHTLSEDARITMELYLLSSWFDHAAAEASFTALSNAEKASYNAGAPTIQPQHYQGNNVPGHGGDLQKHRGGYRGRGAQQRGRGGKPTNSSQLNANASNNLTGATRGGPNGGPGNGSSRGRGRGRGRGKEVTRLDIANSVEFPALGK